VTGWLATITGTYASGLWLAAAAMVAGTLLLMLLKRVETQQRAASTMAPASTV